MSQSEDQTKPLFYFLFYYGDDKMITEVRYCIECKLKNTNECDKLFEKPSTYIKMNEHLVVGCCSTFNLVGGK